MRDVLTGPGRVEESFLTLLLASIAMVLGLVQWVLMALRQAGLLELVAHLGHRADRVRNRAVHPTEDNMLKISTDGRLAALDLRLVGAPSHEPVKLTIAADRIAAIWRTHRDTIYPTVAGAEHPRTGALQLVFSDLGTPREDGWDVYHELREQLHTGGLPAGSIRFAHDATNDIAKGELFAACREGQVAVLIGSTQKMGVGTNVQARAVALHHLDCPWRPADLAQREGRILRQGNHNQEVHILRYVTERSFDAYCWQTVERKARFISQVMRGRLDVREIDDVGDTTLSYQEVKALATGDPRLLDTAQADADLTRLERLERAHHRNRHDLARAARTAEATAAELTTEAAAVAEAITRRVDTRGDAFTITLNGRRYIDRPDAGQALKDLLQPELDRRHPTARGRPQHVIGHLGGFDLAATTWPAGDRAYLELALLGLPRGTTTLTADELRDTHPTGLITRLEHKLTNLERLAHQLTADTEHHHREAHRAHTQLAKPFPHAHQLATTRERATRLHNELNQLAATDTQPTADSKQPYTPSPSTTRAAHAAAALLHPTTEATTRHPRPTSTANNNQPPQPATSRRAPAESPIR